MGYQYNDNTSRLLNRDLSSNCSVNESREPLLKGAISINSLSVFCVAVIDYNTDGFLCLFLTVYIFE